LPRELGEPQHRVDGRVPGADHEHVAAGAEGDVVGNPVGDTAVARLTQRGETVGARWGWALPGAARVDDSACEHPLFAAVRADRVHDEGLCGTIAVGDLVATEAAHPGDAGFEADAVTQRLGEGNEVVAGPL